MKIGILGYGAVGKRLAELCTQAGHTVTIGLREPSANTSDSLHVKKSIQEVVLESNILLVAIPFTAAVETLRPFADKLMGTVIVDCTNPLQADWSPLFLGQENSAGEEIQKALPQSKVVKAFNTIFADVMSTAAQQYFSQPITAFIAGNDTAAKQQVLDLAKAIGFAPVDAGDIISSRYLEAMAHLNIKIAVALGCGTKAAFIYHQKH